MLLVAAVPSFGLDQEPRQWGHIPTDSQFVGGAYAYSEADIALDPVLNLQDVTMELDTWAFKYIHGFELLGKSARAEVTQAYMEGRWEGLLSGEPASTERSGLSDTLLRVAMSIYGAPALQGKEYAAYRGSVKNETVVGLGLVLRLPTGDYEEDKLINLGNNRYALKPQIGLVHSLGPWSFELTGEIGFYDDNDEFFGGNRLEQKPLYIAHGHVIYNIQPGMWFSIGAGYDYGGETRINGVSKDNRQQDTGWGLGYSFPLSRSLGVKISYAASQTEEDTGMDTDNLAIGFAYLMP